MTALVIKTSRMTQYLLLSALLLAVAGCGASDKQDVAEKAEVTNTKWASGLVRFPGLEVQIAPVSPKIKPSDYRIPIRVRFRNPSEHPVAFRSPIPFPVFHGEIKVICPDGQSALTHYGCSEKHVTTEVTFAAGETKEFQVDALGQCGCHARSYPVAGGKGVTSLVLPMGEYTLQLPGVEPVKVQVEESDR